MCRSSLINNKISASKLILERLADSPKPLALFELHIFGVSENAAATRLSELQAQGKVIGTYRNNKKFKEWRLNAPLRPLASDSSHFEGFGMGVSLNG